MTDFASIASEFTDDPLEEPRRISHRGTVWRWQSEKDGTAAWFFLTIDGDAADAIRAMAGPRRGFGSVRVQVTIGATLFATSLFPIKTTGGFMLPLKASVRKAETLVEGSMVEAELDLGI